MKTIKVSDNIEVTNLGMDENEEFCTIDDIEFMIRHTVDPQASIRRQGDDYIITFKLVKYNAHLTISFEDMNEIYFEIFRGDIASYVSRKCILADKKTICGEILKLIDFARDMY